jgi:flagellar protein FliO/FliZ
MGFFGGMPFPVQFFLAFIIVLGLIGATAWAVRRFGGGRLGSVGMRGRQPRLAVVDYASVDARRRLLLIRRDNVEHLVMIGGPTDVVVESNIVRASPAQRDMPTSSRPPALAENPSPRALALPDSAANGSWTLPPEPAPAASMPRAPRGELPQAEPMPFPLPAHGEAQPRPQREPLVALADELAAPKPVPPPRSRPQAPRPPEPRHEAQYEPRPEPRQESRQEPRQESRQEPRAEPRVAVAQPQPFAAEVAAATAATDQNLAEMAQRLEAALRKPNAKADRGPAPEPRAVPMPRAPIPTEPPAAAEPAPLLPAAPSPVPVPLSSRPARVAEAKPRADAKTPSAGKSLYDSLEQEMASLLGRSTAKN